MQAPDLIGYGKEDIVPAALAFRPDEELERIFPLLPAGERFHLAGYSYGGVIALRLALVTPWRLASLTLIEPVAFPLLDRAETSAAYRAVQALRGGFTRLLDSGHKEDAMRRFLDYWTAPGAFEKLEPTTRAEMLRVAAKNHRPSHPSEGAGLSEHHRHHGATTGAGPRQRRRVRSSARSNHSLTQSPVASRWRSLREVAP